MKIGRTIANLIVGTGSFFYIPFCFKVSLNIFVGPIWKLPPVSWLECFAVWFLIQWVLTITVVKIIVWLPTLDQEKYPDWSIGLCMCIAFSGMMLASYVYSLIFL